MLKRLGPDCLPEVSDEDERVWESQQGGKRSAMENLGFDVIVRGGGIDKEAESIENDQELIKPLMLGGQTAAAESCQSRGWSRIRTS